MHMRLLIDKAVWDRIGKSGQQRLDSMLSLGVSYKENLESAHATTTNNRRALENSEIACCFYCCRKWVYGTPPIKEWIDGGATAMCPFCGIDTVIPGNPPKTFLKELHDYWFGC